MVSKYGYAFKKSKKIHKKDFNFKSTNDDIAEDGDGALYAYKPLNFLLTLFGMQKISYNGKNSSPIGWISKLYTTVLVLAGFSMNTLVIYKVVGLKANNWPIIATVINLLGNITSSIGASLSALLSAYFVSPFIYRALKGFNSIDEKLEINKKEYYSHFQKRILIVNLLFVTAATAYTLYQYFAGLTLWWKLVQIITVAILDNMMVMELIDFSIIVWFVVSRFSVYNKRMSEFISSISPPKIESAHNEKVKNGKDLEIWTTHNVSILKENQEKERNDVLLKFMRIFDELADIVYMISSCFGVNLLFNCVLVFLYILLTINGLIMYESVLKAEGEYTRLFVVLWCVPHLTYLIIAAYMSGLIKSEVDNTHNLVDKLSILSSYGSKQSELTECFSQMLAAREVYVTASNFFHFDFTFILSLTGAVATYTVILLQAKYEVSTDSLSLNGTMPNTTMG